MSNIQGKTINFSLATLSDSEFIFSLRVNKKLNKYISTFSGKVEDQRKWLEDYKKRELKGKEFYYIISRNDNGIPIGTVRLYDFIEKDNSFCWGSWIINENKTPSSAIESALLVYKIGFEHLKFSSSHFFVDKKNSLVIDFHKKSGAKIIDEDDINIFFNYNPNIYHSLKEKYNRFL
ncbi:GNAT family N-acetyltransferase [Pectobacterium versatile]|uniref:GNAT family N-acetyltransferase n=1 Tax=Pectobacterium versatile TaxID=2488639 RepID=UPI001CE1D85B|nr:GNAT family N-acetyltransferase [Pectobacterium versatile]MCA5931513.1 GNAT family N-acetyltransferase [Pectobacterium versatile]MCA5948548.1 GNAT family N-acetyltransferase [Pectobacterium versatile]MCA5952819.1 GNAT family N-acetyltransferase [Pectobacterium versatile]MCA6917785.1 GNAT family N-acetyltransferase [Pectobacterium versatile]MCA6939115.1 GNAT family N-acetyltransferase [Pectobacterium versatile]